MKTHLRRSVPAALAAASFGVFALAPNPGLRAANVTWTGNGADGNWDTPGNWNPDVPQDGDDLTFGASSRTTTTVQGSNSFGYRLSSLTFSTGAPAYTLAVNVPIVLDGAGIIGGNATFNVARFINLLGTASAGSATINHLGGNADSRGGLTNFEPGTTAGNAVITNAGGTANGASGGGTFFIDVGFPANPNMTLSTAGNATITSNGGTVSGAGGGFTTFQRNSTAGNATLITNGPTGSGSNGGFTEFTSNATGGTARAVTNFGGAFDISNLSTAGMTIGSIEGGGAHYLGSKNLQVGGNNLTTTVSGSILDGNRFGSGATGGSLTKEGTGTLILNTFSSSYTGGTTINGGVVQVLNGSALGSGPVTVNSVASLTFGNGSSFDTYNVGSIAGSGSISLGNSTLSTGGNNLSTTFSGSFGSASPSGHLIKTGSGTLTLEGSSSLRTVQVNGGTLAVNGSLNLGLAFFNNPLTVSSGARLAGSGSINRGVTLQPDGTLAPGNSVGTLTVAALELQAGSVLDYEFALATNDFVNIAEPSGLTLGGTAANPIEVNLFQEGTTAAFTTAGLYRLLGYNGAFTGDLDGLVVANPVAGLTYDFLDNPALGTIDLLIVGSPIPEPSTWALLLAAGAGSLGLAIRRRKVS